MYFLKHMEEVLKIDHVYKASLYSKSPTPKNLYLIDSIV